MVSSAYNIQTQTSLNTKLRFRALKYWPSTRAVVSDFVAFSADLNGTKLEGFGAYFATNVGQGIIPVAPSLFQQESTSVFMKTIRANGGDSAYVPTTSIYSGADDVSLRAVFLMNTD